MNTGEISYLIGQILGFFIISLLIIFVIIKVKKSLKKDKASVMCTYSLIILLVGLLIGVTFYSVTKIFGITDYHFNVFFSALILLIFLLSAIIAVVGLTQYRKNEFKHGKQHAVISIVIISIIIAANLIVFMTKKDNIQDAISAGVKSFNSKNYEKAVEYYLKADKLHPMNTDFKWKLAISYLNIKKYHEAIEFLNEAIEVVKKRFGPDHKYLGPQYNLKAIAYVQLNDFEKARENFEIALEHTLKNNPEDSFNVGVVMDNLGSVLFRLGNYKKAQIYLGKALKVLTKYHRYDDPALTKIKKYLKNIEENNIIK